MSKVTALRLIEPCPVVAIGASAGGFEAIEAFIAATPNELGAAYVVIMHLDTERESNLSTLLQRNTALSVVDIIDDIEVEPNCFYVLPPGQMVDLEEGRLKLYRIEELPIPRHPIDRFFHSLGALGDLAICVVLSGTGNDGSKGLVTVNEKRGLVIVQNDEAKYKAMPQSAIATGLVDFVLPAKEMPLVIANYLKHPQKISVTETELPEVANLEALQKILSLLRTRTGHDFSKYKSNTILRRIQRRIVFHQLENIGEYLTFIKSNPEEPSNLFREFLIGVTSFFRDQEVFDVLKLAVEQGLRKNCENDEPYRAWIPGCSTGKESYSIAILLTEIIEELELNLSFQIFATDIDEEAVAIARAGRYHECIANEISPERLRRFFTSNRDGHYQIKKTIRESLVFAVQNIISDPPFSKLDLICCRNLLIYFSAELQKQVISFFHYSLKPGGILLLGSSESIGAQDLFQTIDSKAKIFQRLPHQSEHTPAIQFPRIKEPIVDRLNKRVIVTATPQLDVTDVLRAILRESNTPPCVVVDKDMNVVFVHGRTGRYLEPAEGKLNVNILDMARPDLKSDLSYCLKRALDKGLVTHSRNVDVSGNGTMIKVHLVARPLYEPKALIGMAIVVFLGADVHDESRLLEPSDSREEILKELMSTRESLQTAFEELASSNEELQSANEELQSTNEELQSTNEELSTSKEELQSLNEEAETINEELKSRINELSRANDDLKNLLDTTEIATIFLDTELSVRRFTPAAEVLIPLTSKDIGRSITHFATTLVDVDLGKIAGCLLNDLIVREFPVETRDGRNFLLRVRPYRTSRNVIDGVLLTFEDRSMLVQAHKLLSQQLENSEIELEETKNKLEALLSTQNPIF